MKNYVRIYNIRWVLYIKTLCTVIFFSASMKSFSNLDYRIITPYKSSNNQQIEVVIVFWYGCHHCYSLNTMINNRWIKDKKLPSSVTLQHIPGFQVIPGTKWQSHPWAMHAKMYYIMQTLVDKNQIKLPGSYTTNSGIYRTSVLQEQIEHNAHNLIFDSIHKNKTPLKNNKAIKTFFRNKFQVTNKNFQNASNSLFVSKKLMKNSSIMKKYQLTGVPAFIIERSYVIDHKTAGSLENMLNTADNLINQLIKKRNTNKNSKERIHHK